MILVDTCIWVDHLRVRDLQLFKLLDREEVLLHPHIIGELALGFVRDRSVFLAFLETLPCAVVARDVEVLALINSTQLFGQGIGYTDAHLLASLLLTPGASLWTRDKRLLATAAKIAISTMHG